MKDNIFITYDEQNNVTGAFGFEPEPPFIVVPSSVWQQFAIYKKEDLTIEDGQIKVYDSALALMETAKKVQEMLAFLTATNHKDFPRYIPKEGEDMETLYTKREEALLFIRENK
ncbi:MAG: hypothetical protein NT103_08340 [Campylobacterales bacterium]|nr:hypothetical protein [Campylobacterales bacterium]